MNQGDLVLLVGIVIISTTLVVFAVQWARSRRRGGDDRGGDDRGGNWWEGPWDDDRRK